MAKNQDQKKEQLNKYLKFSGLGVQMGVIIGLSAWGGKSLDEYYEFKTPIMTIILSLMGVGISLYVVLKEVTKL